MSDDVRAVKDAIDIAEVIGDYVQLRRAGASLKGLCPFHSEKTPSFTVSPERQTFHCFGCGKGGDVFSFLMEMEGLEFREALVQLADRAGVRLSEKPAREKRRAQARDLRAVLEEAAKFFKSSLTGAGGEAARAYLARRNLGPDGVRAFELGWAPASWDALSKYLKNLGISERETMDAGLSTQGERGVYDRFRGRVMYPVRDEMGRLAGFGGRLIDGEGAKYVNSPEGELFNKRKMLYLLNDAKKSVRERGRMILTEGYMDAIRAHLAGFAETTASLGTAMTEEQAALVKRFTDLCYIVYDADGAGQNAAIRGMYILQKAQVEVRVVVLPQGSDPDDVLSSEGGAELFQQMLARAMPLPLYHVHARRKDLRTPGKQQRAREEVLNGLASLPTLDVAEYIPAISRGFGVLQHELQRELDVRRREIEREDERRGRREREKDSKKSVNDAEEKEGIESFPGVYIDEGDFFPFPDDEDAEGEGAIFPRSPKIHPKTADRECALCSMLWRDPDLCASMTCAEILPLLADEAVAGVVSALILGENPTELEARWRMLGDEQCPGRIARGDAVIAAEGIHAGNVEKLVRDIRHDALQRRYDHLKPLVSAEEATPEENMEYLELVKKLKGGASG